MDNPETPPLLGIDAMHKLKMVVDYDDGPVYTKFSKTVDLCPVPTQKLPSGHLAVNMLVQPNEEQRVLAWNSLNRVSQVQNQISEHAHVQVKE